MIIFHGYKYRIYPDRQQIEQLKPIFLSVILTYNTLLSVCKKAYRETGRFPTEEHLLSCIPLVIKKYPWMKDTEKSVIEKTVSHLSAACRRYQKDSNAGKPARKNSHQQHQSFTVIWKSGNCHLRRHDIKICGIDGVKIKLHHIPPAGSRILSATVSKTAQEEYYVSLLFKISIPDPVVQGHEPRAVGLDFSLSSFFIASDPALVPDPDYLRKYKAGKQQIQRKNQLLSRCQYKSRNYEKRRIAYARTCEHISNQRKDYLQKLSTTIADNYDIVCIETLSMQEMIRHHPEYAKTIEDHGWNYFIQCLEYKCRERGKKLQRVDKWYASSRICHNCGYVNHNLKLSDRSWVCPSCGTTHNRDLNAAFNIRQEGTRLATNSLRQTQPSRLNTPRSIERKAIDNPLFW